MNQISMFELIDCSDCMTDNEKILDSIVCRGANIEGSLDRIKDAMSMPINDFVSFLKHEFGIGGFCHTGEHALWDGSGIKIGVDFDHMVKYTWPAVANAFIAKYS